MNIGRHLNTWNVILVLVFIVLFFAVLYPVLYIFKASFMDPETGAFSLNSYQTFFKYPYYLRCLRNSLFVSALATGFALVIGIPFAFFLSRYDLPGKDVIKTLGTLPLILPTFIGAEAWIMLLGRNGLLANTLGRFGLEAPTIYGWKGIVLVYTLQFFPYVFLMVSSAVNAIDRSLEEAATSLGASRLRAFFTVTLPLVTPAILSGALVVFYLSIENFGVPILIGEDFRVLSVQAYNEFISEMGGNPSMAGALSMILLSLTLLLTVVQKYWTERKTYAITSVQRTAVKRLSLLPTALIWVFCAGLVFIALFPFLVVVVAAFTKAHGPVMYYGQFTLDHFIKAFTIAPRPILNSFFLATAATLIGIVFGLVVSYLLVRRRGTVSYVLDVLTMLPLAIAGTVQGIALAVTYNKGLVVLTGTWMILVLAYFIRKVPFSIKTTSALLHQIDRNIEDASVNLGVPPFRSFLKVILPVMMPGIIAGAIIMWVTTLAELSSTIVLYYGPWATMTVEIFQRINSGDFGPASAFATVLIVSVLIPLFILHKLLGRDLTTAL
ncbi:MAG: iron ABC transporter permease [Syntrophales bacterium]|jgi:iron(III) transport system permease protein|nr:iron ABC transporter permease [Syntrophales bacterium]MDD4338840.1 iron ABC transporter permease [Syntrophales bacterium]HOG08756.1 iron ABC transporter permease [Syntrophales bacterium]HOS77259.1 iron ABC transporter permease [Syntrophales bacterium]HPB71091.1 iron ABC transporter permease [Syntrophales bacterium]